MKTLRRLALLALFSFTAASATAGPPAYNDPAANRPVRNAPRLFTTDDLGAMLKEHYKSVDVASDGNTFSVSKLTHKLKSGLMAEWSVQIGIMSRGLRSPVVRVFFPCQKLPTKQNSDRLAKLLNQNGGGTTSPAYFMVGGKDSDWLYIVAEMTTEGLTGDILKEEVGDLFSFAEQTMTLWREDLTKSLAKDMDTKDGLVGSWRLNRLLDVNVGVTGLTLSNDGSGEMGVYEVSNAPPINKPGKYTLQGDELTFTTKGGTTLVFIVKQVGDELTITYKQDGETITRTLSRTK